ncbi:MAG: urea carboxylase-associated family protein [Deltaproteobacteria bacterium]|nr:MAG: urea carboxylase-associated family protein [Deltaproteobacteria bacterium]HXG97509.1 urea carboxylase-associated family protein [Gemmatimonadales bacterium]
MTLVTIPAREGAGLRLERGQRLRLVDPLGGQSGDLVTFRWGDITEWLSNGRSFDYGGKLYFSTGDVLYSNKSAPMLTIIDDDVGNHDFLYTACSIEMYRIQYGLTGDHPSCLDNLTRALAPHGVEAHRMPTPFNFFMSAKVQPDGRLVISPPRSKAGDAIVLRAEMDLAVGLSACPSLGCNGGSTKPLAFEIFGA